MGQDQPTMSPSVLKSALRQSKARINIRRGQRVNNITKKKKEIKAYLESGNETMALIHVEPLINDERMVPCYDIIAMLCDAVLERMPILERGCHDIPPDMYMTLHTLIYAADRAGIDELFTIREQLTFMCGKEFASKSETDEKCIHEIVRENINLIMPEEGWKVERLIQIARDEGIQYTPTEKSQKAYNKYADAKAGADDLSKGVPSPFPYFPPQMQQPVIPSGPYNNYQNPPHMYNPMPGPPSMQGPPNQFYNPQPFNPEPYPNSSPYPTLDIPPAPAPGSAPVHGQTPNSAFPPSPQVPPGQQFPSNPGYPPSPAFPSNPPADPPANPPSNMPPNPMGYPGAGPEVKSESMDDFEARLANLKKM